jgi:hypothetical protein
MEMMASVIAISIRVKPTREERRLQRSDLLIRAIILSCALSKYTVLDLTMPSGFDNTPRRLRSAWQQHFH